jgi:hypothetical protein
MKIVDLKFIVLSMGLTCNWASNFIYLKLLLINSKEIHQVTDRRIYLNSLNILNIAATFNLQLVQLEQASVYYTIFQYFQAGN